MSERKPIKTALISVYHKDGLEDILKALNADGVELLSTGGTQKFIEGLGYPCKKVEELTTYPSILGGRVKTLHPRIFGGILARRDNEGDQAEMQKYEIPSIDLVIVDLYPFEETVKSGASEADIIEKIDIGGISLIRAGAKNFKDVVIIPSKAQYAELLSFTQFGSDLDPITQKTIDHGARLQAVLVQPQYAPLTMPQQVVSLYAVEHGFMDTIDIERISAFERALHRDMQAKHADLLDAIEEKGVLDDDMVKELEAGITESLNDFMLINGA